MKEWVDAPVYVQDVTYNHVPVNTYGIKKGIDGSIQYPIVAMQPQHFSDIVTTLNQKVIQDKNNLYAVVLLLNNDTGEIINADRAEIMPYGSNLGITQKPAETSPSHIIYNIKGQRVDRVSNHGIYIVNGRKVIK